MSLSSIYKLHVLPNKNLINQIFFILLWIYCYYFYLIPLHRCFGTVKGVNQLKCPLFHSVPSLSCQYQLWCFLHYKANEFIDIKWKWLWETFRFNSLSVWLHGFLHLSSFFLYSESKIQHCKLTNSIENVKTVDFTLRISLTSWLLTGNSEFFICCCCLFFCFFRCFRWLWLFWNSWYV